MYKIFLKIFLRFCLLTYLFSSPLIAEEHSESFEQKRVDKISVVMENLSRGATFDQERVIAKLRTKQGDPFSHITFDQDLKALSEEYDRVEPLIEVQKGDLIITLKLWQKPIIRSIKWHGNKQVSTKKLQKELGIQPYTLFNRDQFSKAFNKVKEYYIKKGFFEAILEYKIIPLTDTNEMDIDITIHEGHSGHISKISFSGFEKEEESAVLSKITTKKHNIFSFLHGTGKYREEALDFDERLIVNYLQNRGYANARVHIQVMEAKDGKLEIHIKAVKGEKFHFGKIEISGNTLISTDKIKKHLKIHSGDPYSPEEMQSSIQNIKDLYGKDGYIETKVAPTLHLSEKEPVYDVKIEIEEGKQFRVGLIRVLGNVHTKKNVILRESLLVPGQVFDSRLLKYTQQKLEAIGYFKSVNVYAVKTSEDEQMGENYRDVIIEVDESPTGSAAIFFGLSTMEDVFVGIDLAENNFDHRGLTRFWKDGFSSLRGAGEYAHVKAQVGVKQQIYSMAWINPYFNDSLWRFGSDLSYSKSELQSKDYKVYSLGGSLFGSYPINAYWTFGWKYRLRNAVIDIHGVENEEAQRERKNSGLVSGLGASLSFDSTDNPFKPHQGFRSVIEGELAGVRRHSDTDRMFPFFRIGYLNAYYYPVWRKGTLKTRCDFKFNCPFASGDPSLLPLSERFFLGGETSVRGYKPYILGPKFKKKNGTKDSDDPTGGVSSALLSVEYMQHFHKIFDGFIFFDGGSISPKRFDIPDFRMSAGLGVRFELINRIPLTFGVGFPINPKSKDDVRKFFFSMGGQF